MQSYNYFLLLITHTTICSRLYPALNQEMDRSDHEGLNQFKTLDKGKYINIPILLFSTRNLKTTATSTPLLKDLYQHITPNYASDWKVIGTLLGLPSGTLDIIEHDNHHKAIPSCNAMLKKWLEVDPSASWEKLFKVIESPAVSSDQAPDKGD